MNKTDHHDITENAESGIKHQNMVDCLKKK